MGHYIGLDLGGTNIKAGVVDDDARVLSRVSIPTPGESGPEAVMQAMAEAAQAAADQAKLTLAQIDGIGIGAPGMLDLKRGLVLAAPNLPGWKNTPIRDRITELTGRPAVLENDANAAAFGEYWAGAGRDPSVRNLIMITLGTGVGSGIVIDGKLLHGAFDLGAEAGHLIVVPNGRLCGCGQRGCIEAYASASSTARRACEAVKSGEESSLARDFGKQPDRITAKDVFEAANRGDALATRIVEETATYLGIACISLCRVLDPQMIVFAGGMILAGDQLFDRVRAAFRAHDWHVVETRAQLVPALLGNDAGFIGAAAVAWDAFGPGRRN